MTTRHVTSGAQQVDDPAIRLLRQAVSARAVCAHPMTTQAGALLVFDEGGITGHPDHRQATAAALFAAAEREDLTVPCVGHTRQRGRSLNTEFGNAFLRRGQLTSTWRSRSIARLQRAAISRHASQSTHNPVLWRRLELLGNVEQLRYLRRVNPSSKGQE